MSGWIDKQSIRSKINWVVNVEDEMIIGSLTLVLPPVTVSTLQGDSTCSLNSSGKGGSLL